MGLIVTSQEAATYTISFSDTCLVRCVVWPGCFDFHGLMLHDGHNAWVLVVAQTEARRP